MIDPPRIIHTEPKTTAVVRLTIPRQEMVKAFGPAAGELIATLAAQGVKPQSAVFAHHVTLSPEFFDFEVGVEVAAPVTATGRVMPSELPATRIARTVYSGPYEGLPAAWHAFEIWIKENGHAPSGRLWEVYAVGPQSTPDPAGWRTELNRPLQEQG
jgi:effector-binding domain-containing protein